MKILYFDCFNGISGDMTVGALVDLGVDRTIIERELSKLKLEAEFELQWEKVVKKGVSATKMNVMIKKQTDQTHHHRHYHHIVELIRAAEFNDSVTQMALAIFEKIGTAEGKIHNIPLEKVHFHEVGAIDSIVDIVATAVAIDQIKPDKILSAPVPVGSGTITIDHGIYPVPAPATLEILRHVPLQETSVASELTTPTGAGIISALVTEFGTMPPITVREIGYGAGTKDFLDRPNVLRIVVGDDDGFLS